MKYTLIAILLLVEMVLYLGNTAMLVRKQVVQGSNGKTINCTYFTGTKIRKKTALISAANTGCPFTVKKF